MPAKAASLALQSLRRHPGFRYHGVREYGREPRPESQGFYAPPRVFSSTAGRARHGTFFPLASFLRLLPPSPQRSAPSFSSYGISRHNLCGGQQWWAREWSSRASHYAVRGGALLACHSYAHLPLRTSPRRSCANARLRMPGGGAVVTAPDCGGRSHEWALTLCFLPYLVR